MKKNNDKQSFFISGKMIFLVQVITSVLTLAAVMALNLIPIKYFAAVVGIVIVFALMTISIVKNVEGKTKGFRKVLSLLLSLLMAVMTLKVYNGDSIIRSITGASKDTHVMSMVVLDDSGFKDFNDVKDELFGANTGMDSEIIAKSLLLISNQHSHDIRIDDYTNYQSLTRDLYNGTLNVILLNESHRTFITDYDEDFDKRTRIVAQVSYDVEVQTPGKDADVSNDTFSIFLSGIDTYGPVSTTARSDVNMVMTVNPQTNQILLTSIPRDYHVLLPRFGEYDKLTHAGIYGVGESVAALEHLLNIEINYYAKVNFSSLTQIVDELDGVTVYSRYTFIGPGDIQFYEGDNYVNGAEALSFVRERYSFVEGDNARVMNQQALVTGILNKAMTPAIISNFSSILSAIDGSFETSMPSSSLKSFIKVQADTMKSWEIIEIQLSGYGSSSSSTASMPGWNLYVMEPDQGSVDMASSLIAAMERNEVISRP